jgi:hypothetical protein
MAIFIRTYNYYILYIQHIFSLISKRMIVIFDSNYFQLFNYFIFFVTLFILHQYSAQ